MCTVGSRYGVWSSHIAGFQLVSFDLFLSSPLSISSVPTVQTLQSQINSPQHEPNLLLSSLHQSGSDPTQIAGMHTAAIGQGSARGFCTSGGSRGS
jgi:hypothetical protein